MLNSSFTPEQKRELFMKAYNDNKEKVDARIEQGIEQNRKGEGKIQFIDSCGKPLANKKVKLTQKTHDFKYGANIFLLDEFKSEADNAEYRRMFKEYFNLATVPFYWDTLEPKENKPRYAADSPKVYRRPAPDLCLDYCNQSGIDAKLHCLVYEHFVPEWLKKRPLEQIKAKYEERFKQISERYAGKLMEFEVINELLCYWNESAMSRHKDILEWSFDLARKYFPDETLVINEGSLLCDIAAKDYKNPYYMMIENTLLKGSTIDKIGIQNHMFVGANRTTDEGYDASIKEHAHMTNPLSVFKGLDILSEFNLPLEITEVTFATLGDSEEDEDLQADILKLMYSVWFSHPAIDTVVYWNTVDGYTYDSGNGWNENNCIGGLFHHDLTPKKSALMLKKLFNELWHTECELTTDENGCVSFRGFYGNYDALCDGKTAEFGLHKESDKNYILKI
ncbi:MAG: endo-1,4-beta-xylanase [Clostridia bacterium]|nr:endo-1,4-beta-xylanase [Clostridia bacterium]